MPRAYGAVQGKLAALGACGAPGQRLGSWRAAWMASAGGSGLADWIAERAVVGEHPIWSAVGCANSQTNRRGALQHPDRATVPCQGLARHRDGARGRACRGGSRTDARLGDLLGMRRDQAADPRRQADSDVAPHGLLERPDAGAGDASPGALPSLWRADRASAVGAAPLSVHARVR